VATTGGVPCGAIDREDPVLLDQLAGVGHRVLRPVAVVVEDGADLAAVDAARVVDDLDVEIDAELRGLLAGEGQRARERVRAAPARSRCR
jgi:hypothetical protein